MKKIKVILIILVIFYPSSRIENSYIATDPWPIVIVEGGFIYLLNEQLKEGKLW